MSSYGMIAREKILKWFNHVARKNNDSCVNYSKKETLY